MFTVHRVLGAMDWIQELPRTAADAALRRAEDLVLAMESRCYMGGKGRTKFVQFTARPLDYVVPVLAIILLIVVVAIPWPSIHTFVPFLGL